VPVHVWLIDFDTNQLEINQLVSRRMARSCGSK
jgi:hypothetical protein